MSAGRCQCVAVWSNGDVTRCQHQLITTEKYCYHHDKVMKGLTGPAPQDCYNPDAPEQVYITHYMSTDGEERRSIPKEEKVTMYI